MIDGNNTGDLYTLGRIATRRGSVVRYHGMNAASELGRRRIFLVHYPPHARAMAATGEWDLVCCGQSHQASIERIHNLKGQTTPVVDPGTVGGVGEAPATWILGNLSSLELEIHAVNPSRQKQAG